MIATTIGTLLILALTLALGALLLIAARDADRIDRTFGPYGPPLPF